MEITKEILNFSKGRQTPFLIMDLDILKENYNRIRKIHKDLQVFYAVKANSNVRIIETLRDLGSSFDVASRGEIEKLLSLNISPKKMSFGNTIKKESHIAYAHEIGIEYFAIDSEMELEKVARNAPGAKVYGRILMNSMDSDWPLSRKFGTDIDHIQELMIMAKELGLVPYGMNFHVGSQTLNKFSWKQALLEVADIFITLKENHGIELELINLGGGMPIQHTKPIPTVEEVGEVIKTTIEDNFGDFPNLKLFIEPGRSMVGNIGTLVSEVILRSNKQKQEWLFIDSGIFHGLFETIEDFRYEIVVPGKKREQLVNFTLAGPTCDSIDIIYDEVDLPFSTTLGDLLFFKNAGAYTVEYATSFNGINPPDVYILQDIRKIRNVLEMIQSRENIREA